MPHSTFEIIKDNLQQASYFGVETRSPCLVFFRWESGFAKPNEFLGGGFAIRKLGCDDAGITDDTTIGFGGQV